MWKVLEEVVQSELFSIAFVMGQNKSVCHIQSHRPVLLLHQTFSAFLLDLKSVHIPYNLRANIDTVSYAYIYYKLSKDLLHTGTCDERNNTFSVRRFPINGISTSRVNTLVVLAIRK